LFSSAKNHIVVISTNNKQNKTKDKKLN